MPESRCAVLLTTFLLASIPATLPAQYALGVGVTVPTGDFANTAEPGWMLAAGYSPWRSNSGALRLWLQGYYGENATEYLDTTEGNHLAMIGLGVSLKNPAQASPTPYLIGAVGYLRHSGLGASEGAPYLGAGAGVSLGRAWMQARYQRAQLNRGTLGFVLIAAGTSF